MKGNFAGVAVGLFAAALASGIAVAQTQPEVTVQASRVVNQKLVGHTSAGIPIVDVSLSYGVSYAGLNLALHADVMELEKRVNDAAQAACKELGRKYPVSQQTDAECAKQAVDKAMAKVNELAAAASGK